MIDPTTAPATSVVLERVVAHAPGKVWRALTETPLLDSWLMASDFRPEVGHRFHFRAPGGPGWNGVTACEVLQVEAPTTLAYTWATTGEQAGMKTVVTWTLTPVEGGTRVRMEQTGFRPEDARAAAGAKYGWAKYLDALERLVAELA
jgi:uncharacterized protein YndB with AHSA1/START domain